MDIGNFGMNLLTGFKGLPYVNDKQIKEYHVYKDDECDKEYFKIIVEEMEWETRKEIQNKESIERKLELVNNRIDIETDDDVITEMLILKERRA